MKSFITQKDLKCRLLTILSLFKMETEIRTNSFTPNITGRTIRGYAIVFNSPSEVLIEGGKRFKEVILPSAITYQTLENSDIKFTIEHDREKLLARQRKGKGTLSTRITPKGIMYQIESPHTADGNFAVEMIKRGDISGASFAFVISGDRWEKKGGENIRYVTKISRIYDMTITADPAYNTTTAYVRSLINDTPDGRKKLDERAKASGVSFAKNEKLTVEQLRKKYNL